MKFKTLLFGTAVPAILFAVSPVVMAQTTITEDTTENLQTSNGDGNGNPTDIIIDNNVTVSPAGGTAITIDSDNSVTNNGVVSFADTDNVVGVDLQGGNTGNFTNAGSIQITEDFTPADLDGDNIPDEGPATGEGRTGILISGASPFNGNVNLEATSTLTVEGNNSYGMRLIEAASLLGDANLGGVTQVVGTNSRGYSFEGDVTGNITHTGSVSVSGQNASAIVTEGLVTGGIVNSGSVANTGFRFTQRPAASTRQLLDADDLQQAASAISIHGDVTNGLRLQETVETITNEDGSTASQVTARSSVNQLGSAPAILIDGRTQSITLGVVATITDPTDENFNEDLQFAFVNQGEVVAQGVFDDLSATTVEIRNATLEQGFRNTGALSSTTFRSGDDGSTLSEDETALSRVIVFGDAAMADSINNSGLIAASVSETTDTVFADLDNILPARRLEAVAIDIEAGATLVNLINSGTITALTVGRDGDAIVVRDLSGTLSRIENTGTISALGATSDPQQLAQTDFRTVALDLSANTSGVSILQSARETSSQDNGTVPADPTIRGDVLLGAGADTVDIRAGSLTGALSFGAGADRLLLSGGSTFEGALTDSDGQLSLDVSQGSTLTQTSTTALNVTDASFDGTSIYRPTIDGAANTASNIISSGDIALADGASISPILQNFVNFETSQFTLLDAGGELTVEGDLAALGAGFSPLLYDISYARDPNDANALIVTLDLRSATELGLDPVQTAGLESGFEAFGANSDLANAFINISDQDELSLAINQLLPEFAAAARQFVVSNVDGATGAVGNRLDNARLSTDKPGGVWLQEFAYFADRDLSQLSEQYRGFGFGFAGGADRSFGPFHTVGVNFGFASTEIEDVIGFDDPMDVVTLLAGTYLGYSRGNLGIEANVGAGINDFEQTRNVNIGNFVGETQGDWQGIHYNASLRAGYDIRLGESYFVRPLVAIDYLSLTEEAYTESGPAGLALSVDERTSELGGITGMLNFGAKFEGKDTWWRPALKLGVRHEFINDGVVTDFGFAGLTRRSTLVSSEFPETGLLVGFSLSAGSKYSSFGLDFDSDVRDGFVRHTGRIVIRLIF